MSIKNGDLPAMPVIEEIKYEQYNGGTLTTATAVNSGLTKREMFAMAIAQGLAAQGGQSYIARDAVLLADELLNQLEISK